MKLKIYRTEIEIEKKERKIFGGKIEVNYETGVAKVTGKLIYFGGKYYVDVNGLAIEVPKNFVRREKPREEAVFYLPVEIKES